MSIALRTPRMTRAEFFDWADSRDGRYEFDGVQPVAMVGATRNHGRIAQNIYSGLRTRLRGGPCEVLGPDAGLATIGDAVRYPDALVSCTRGPGSDRVIPGVVVVFEVLSPTSGRTDRIVKLREYRAVSSIRRYVIVEYAGIGLMSLERTNGSDDWTVTALASGDILRMPEIGVEVPVAELYEGVDLADSDGEGAMAADPG
jgi:Uma2 family endonuclease